MRWNSVELPENLNEYWTVPDFKSENGVVRTFSNYYVHKETGDIWSCIAKRNLKPTKNLETGYYQTAMMDDANKPFYRSQHRIVLACKIQSWDFEDCHHESKNRLENHPDNLEPLDSKVHRAKIRNKLTEENVKDIRLGALSADNRSEYIKFSAIEYGVTTNTIRVLLSNKTWTYVV